MMKCSELETLIKTIREQHGDIPVVWESLHRRWDPDPVVRESIDKQKFVILNS